MCGRFAVSQYRFTHVEQALGVTFAPVQTKYNIAPTDSISVIRLVDDQYVMSEMKWGLIPAWSKTPSPSFSTINARLETVAEKPAFRSAFKYRRCLIPASGFYEWQTEGNLKQPYYFTLAEGEEMGLAGLWEKWKGADGTIVQSCTIIVGAPNAMIEKFHDRMPVIIPENHYRDWLNPSAQTDYLLAMLGSPYLADKIQVCKVGMTVNSVRNDGPELIVPLE